MKTPTSQIQTIYGPCELEYVNCNLCGSSRSKELFKEPDKRYRWISSCQFAVVKCKNCGLCYLNPRPTFESISRFYPKEYYTERESPEKEKQYQLEAAYWARMQPGRLLDIGCAGGGFLNKMESLGWEVQGMDLSRADLIRNHINVRYGQLPHLAYPESSFDLITAWAVFEHLHDPATYFKEVHRLLKSDGIFCLLVPNFNSLWARVQHSDDIPRHVHFFTRKSLLGYARLAGLELTTVEQSRDIYEGSCQGWWITPLFYQLIRKTFRNQESRFYRRVMFVAYKTGCRLDRTFARFDLERRLRLLGTLIVTMSKTNNTE